MSYQPYPIAKYATGLDEQLQPWLLPEDAFVRCFDAFLLRGVLRKRDGYSQLAYGVENSAPYCESRMVARQTSYPTGQTNNGSALTTITLPETPIRRGTVTVTDGTESHTDNGTGSFTTAAAGSINYANGEITGFQFNASSTAAVTVTFDWHPDEPVMGFMNFYTSTGTEQLFVCNEKRVNQYDTTNNRLSYVGRELDISNISQANPGVVTTTANHGLQTGDKVYIYGVVGMTEVNDLEFTVTNVTATTFSIGVNTTGYTAYSSGGKVQQVYTGDNKNFWHWDNYLSADDNPRLIFTNNADNIQIYDPTISPAFIDYVSSSGFSFPQLDAGGGAEDVLKLQSRYVKGKNERMLLFNVTATVASGTLRYPSRIWISGPGISVDDFTDTNNGAGFIDLDDGSEIYGVEENRDDIYIQTRRSTYLLKYTGNDIIPYEPILIDGSVGSDAPYGTHTRFNETRGATKRKFTVSDGYRVSKMDEKIEDYSYQEIDADNFDLVYVGMVEEDHLIYWIHPQPNETESSRILTYNFEEDSWSVFRIGLSCMGVFQKSFDVVWSDLSIYSNWDELAQRFQNWDAFSWMEGTPIAVGGGHHGEVWQLQVSESEDNPQRVRAITDNGDGTADITTDWNNYAVGDYIYLTGLGGSVELNNKQFAITSVTNNYTFVIDLPEEGMTAYTSGGNASKVIEMDVITKKYNPYVGSDKKVKCGWLYMYVNTDQTLLERSIPISDADQTSPCAITTTVSHNLETGDRISIFSVGGMTELNNAQYTVTVTGDNTFTLNGIDATGFTAYTSGGWANKRLNSEIKIQIINNTDRVPQITSPSEASEYIGNMTNLVTQTGYKKWYKLWINQVGQFIQFRFINDQAGGNVRIESHMPGFQPRGRLI